MRSIMQVVVLSALAGCASGGGSEKASTDSGRGDRSVITRAQIEQQNVQDAYEVVRRLRSEYLREQRGPSSLRSSTPLLAVVYVDGVRRGGPESLRGIQPAEIEEIRFLNGADATTRYGTDHGGGVIAVMTRR